MQIAIVTFVLLGVLLSLVGTIWFYAETLHESFIWFLVCLFIPLAGLLFLILHFERAIKPSALIFLGSVFAFIGYFLRNSLR